MLCSPTSEAWPLCRKEGGIHWATENKSWREHTCTSAFTWVWLDARSGGADIFLPFYMLGKCSNHIHI